MKFSITLITISLACLKSFAQTNEALLSYDLSGNTIVSGIVGYANGTAGWSFQSTADISVTSLGCFDYVLSENESSIMVGLWAVNGSLLASSTISSDSLLFDQTRYESISPINLEAGLSYYLGAYSPNGTIVFSVVDPADGFGSASMSPEIQLGNVVIGTPGFTFPTDAGSGGSAIIAPNFLFQDSDISPAPEPSSLSLGCLGGIAAIIILSRKIVSQKT